MQAELGGHNPLVVLADADIAQAVAIAVDGAFMSTGQKCTATRRILVQDSVFEEFLQRLTEAAEALRVGDPTDPATDVGPVISAEQLALNEQAVHRARTAGAHVVTGGRRGTDPTHEHGWYYAPTILTEVEPDDEIAQEEAFGPIVSLFPVAGLGDAIDLANGTDYGLSASICTRDLEAAETFVRRSQSGVVAVNAATAGIEVQAPLLGVKGSGLGPPSRGRTPWTSSPGPRPSTRSPARSADGGRPGGTALGPLTPEPGSPLSGWPAGDRIRRIRVDALDLPLRRPVSFRPAV